ncbi:MAG: cupin domain-containing protein [Candidatus Promineifilaceae bacterium]|nr:cupin domain-containing protein [Candidatus Promineifilaceae bacterium]
MITPQQLIEMFKLEPLPIEGGLFFQTYHSEESIPKENLPDRYSEDKPFGTAIVYLLTDDPDSFSALHRLPTDEVYHFYLGDPVELLQLHPDGRSARIILGHDLPNGQRVQHVVPRDVWQGSHLLPGGQFALLGTTMAPGYTDEDYDGGRGDDLAAEYPEQAQLIAELTR